MDTDQFRIGNIGDRSWVDSISDDSSEIMGSSAISSSDYSVDSSTEKVSVSSSFITNITKFPIYKTVVSV